MVGGVLRNPKNRRKSSVDSPLPRMVIPRPATPWFTLAVTLMKPISRPLA